jgi:hypothetical protein
MINPGLLFPEKAVTRHHMTNTAKSIPTSPKISSSFSFFLFFFVFILMENNQETVSGVEI